MKTIKAKDLVKFSTLENGDLVVDVILQDDGNVSLDIQSYDWECGEVDFLPMVVSPDEEFIVSYIP